jgi:hypothetical protein
MTSAWSISTSVVADVDDDFDDFCLPLPPLELNKNDALNDALMSEPERMQKKLEQIISQAQAKAKEATKQVRPLDHYVERYVLPAVNINVTGRSTSSGFIPDDYEQNERKFGRYVSVLDDKPSITRKPTSRRWFSHLCRSTQVRY